ncbi:MAG: DUF262 domain-containing protein [Alphaproteobacteria bacterium]
MKISECISAIQQRDLVLPEFQREYVWSRDQAKQLLVSLLKGYPVGGLLIWPTNAPPELKNIGALPPKLGTVRVLLDGQQRLTTLHMFVSGNVPRYYTAADIENDPRDLYFNIDDADFQYYQSSKMSENPLWHRVIDCFYDGNDKEKQIQVFAIARKLAADDQQAFELAQRYTDNLTALRNIQNIELPVQTVPSKANLDVAIDIFDRVNSQGTKLTDAELALTHVTGKWSTARRELKTKIADLEARNFVFNLTFMTRALTVCVTRRALFETIHERAADELQVGWKVLSQVLDYLTNVLPHHAFVHSTQDLNTTNALIPLVAYLSLNKGKFATDKALRSAVHWLYAALLWARYTAQTDQRLESDVSIVMKEETPWGHLCGEIIDQRGRIEVKASDFEGRGAQHPLYLGTYVLAKAHSAIDWFNGAALGVTHGAKYRIHSHHIFPQSVLYNNGFDADNHLDRKVVNEIANRAFLTAETNQSIASALPAEYLPRVDESYPGALVKQFIPMDPELWRVERYRDFLVARREIVGRKLNEFMTALVREPEITENRPVSELIKLGESINLEFKSTLQWDVVNKQVNAGLRLSVLKTIAAFMNTEGGTLIIGVEDDGSVFGLDPDLKSLNGSRDQLGQLLANLISQKIGAEYGHLAKVRFENIDEKIVCVVDTDRAFGPAFVSGEKGSEFYVRVGNTTRALDPEETVKYTETHWE